MKTQFRDLSLSVWLAIWGRKRDRERNSKIDQKALVNNELVANIASSKNLEL